MAKSPGPVVSLSLRIRQAHGQLPKAEKQLADLILESPGQMASYSATEISRMAGVSNATVTRLVRRLGYENYEQMRRLAREGIDWGSPLFLPNHDGGAAEPVSQDLFEEHVLASTRNIRDSFAGIDPETIGAVCDGIASARQVRIFGQRNNYFFAAYLRWQFIQFRSNVYLLPVSGETLAEYLAGLEQDDIFILFGLRRRHPGLPDLIATIKTFNVKTILITDASCADDLGADWVLRCHTRSPIALDNHTAVMALCHVLSAQLIARAGRKGRQRLARIEDLHAQLGEL
jgi:DNA-binding MurR/RpiR family transcriptional regulator